jgi:integrase
MHIISDRAGHSGIQVTADIYTHIFPSQQAEASSAIDSILRGEGARDCDTNVISDSKTG